MPEVIRQTLANLREEMSRHGRGYGQKVRREQGVPPIPESVREGNSRRSEASKAKAFRSWCVATMWRIGFLAPDPSETAGRKARTLQEFFDRTQDDIDPHIR